MYVFFRVTLLELIFAQLKEEGSEKCGVPPSVARFLADSFQKSCGAVLTLATGSASSDEVQIVNQNDVSSPGLEKTQRSVFSRPVGLVMILLFPAWSEYTV